MNYMFIISFIWIPTALDDPVNNYNVFALLLAATEDGAAASKVNTFEPTCNGHLAWRALIDWYDGTHMVCATAATLKYKLNHLKLTPGVTPLAYINKFTTFSTSSTVWGGNTSWVPTQQNPRS